MKNIFQYISMIILFTSCSSFSRLETANGLPESRCLISDRQAICFTDDEIDVVPIRNIQGWIAVSPHDYQDLINQVKNGIENDSKKYNIDAK